jgi:hypothetical protein
MMVKYAHQKCAERLILDVMREADHKGFTPQDLADAVGGSARTYENYKYGASPTIEKVVGISRAIKSEEMARICATWAGGYFVSLPGNGPCGPDTIAKYTSNIMSETSDVVRVVADSLKDGVVSKQKKGLIVKEIDEAVVALLRAKLALTDDRDR